MGPPVGHDHAPKVPKPASKRRCIKWSILLVAISVLLAAAVLIPIYFFIIKPNGSQNAGNQVKNDQGNNQTETSPSNGAVTRYAPSNVLLK
jgi:hypothetical protein